MAEPMGLLDDKVAIITGAGADIGRATALLFAAEGAQVVVHDCGGSAAEPGSNGQAAQQVAGEIEAAGGVATACTTAASSAAGAEAIVAAAVAQLGRLDILVNSVDRRDDQSLLEMTEAAWVAVVDAHLKAAFLLTQAAAKQLVGQGEGGRIVNTTSLSALQGQSRAANLGTAQAGIYGLTQVAAIELQRHRITVNAIAPVAKTQATAHQSELDSLGELTPEHVAPAALMLACDLCGDRTGQLLGVCGSRVYRLALVQSRGKLKDQDAPWTAEEIAEHWDGICKV